jgi:transposase-like protein
MPRTAHTTRVTKTADTTRSHSAVKSPERCPSCNSTKVGPKGMRAKKLETIRLYRCKACGRTFTPGPRAMRNKTYPLNEILEAFTIYNRGNSLEDTSRRLSSRYSHPVNPATISRWLTAHPGLTTYRRLRASGLRLFKPPQIIRAIKLYHRQVYEFAYHRAKLAFLRNGTLDDRRSGDTRFAPLADFLDRVAHTRPDDLFRREDGARCSQLPPGFLALDRLTVFEKQNIATDTAALIIPSVGSNHDRHPKLQRFMLANDSATLAVEVPIWLVEDDIAALEDMYGVAIVAKEPIHAARPDRGHKPRFITGHIDFLQARNGAIHILDYKPDARTNKPIAQLSVYALALTRLVPGLKLFDIRCAWFNENCYNEFYPRLLLPHPKISFHRMVRQIQEEEADARNRPR